MRSPASLALLCLTLVPAVRAQEILPLDQVKPGMVGVGRTVFEGTKIEDFKVEIIGVLENVAPKQSIILARLEGGPLEKTGVIAGMSGSPVFIDGKLVGAVAYGFPFSKETIGGITPIGEMIEAAAARTPRAPSTKLGLDPTRPLGPEAFLAALQRPGAGPMQALMRQGSLPAGVSPQAM